MSGNCRNMVVRRFRDLLALVQERNTSSIRSAGDRLRDCAGHSLDFLWFPLFSSACGLERHSSPCCFFRADGRDRICSGPSNGALANSAGGLSVWPGGYFWVDAAGSYILIWKALCHGTMVLLSGS